jgi:hypothetical protein
VQQPTIHQHPLAYLLGLEGIALLRAFSGGYDREFTAARLLEIKELLDSRHELGAGIEATPLTTRHGLRAVGAVLRRAGQPAARHRAAALQVRRCEEPRRPAPLVDDDGTPVGGDAPPAPHMPGNPPNIWSLHRLCPGATNAAWRGQAAAIIWHFQLTA